MYSLMVKREFTASHYLTGGNFGPENSEHSHDYELELILEGNKLNEHNFLTDIVEVNMFLDALIADYENHLLNSLPGFENQNPSLELFARILCEKSSKGLMDGNIQSFQVRLWENKTACASYRMER